MRRLRERVGPAPRALGRRTGLGAAAVWAACLPLFVLALDGCSDGSPPGPVQPEPEVDLEALFAPPSEAEIAAVRAEWSARSLDPVDVRDHGTEPFMLGSVPATLRVLSHAIPGGRHYGAVVTADGATDGSLPVVVYAHGGDAGVDTDQLAFVASLLGDASADFAWVVPSFRSETLTTGGGAIWPSGGEPSPWDHDVDDALVLLGAALEHTPQADAGLVGVLGLSRGGGVGLLMGVRDPRIDRVVEFFGPTDFFGPFARDVIEEALAGSLRDLPGLPDLNERFIQPLAEGLLGTSDARRELVRRSAVLFADELPPVQIHHGTQDAVVDVSQAESLVAVLDALGRGPPVDEFFLYEGGTHNPLTLGNSVERTRAFLGALAGAAAPAAPR